MCLAVCLLGWLPGWLAVWLVALLVGCLAACLPCRCLVVVWVFSIVMEDFRVLWMRTRRAAHGVGLLPLVFSSQDRAHGEAIACKGLEAGGVAHFSAGHESLPVTS